jgi:DNA-binding NarL/FixJ family response regulator
MSLQSALTGFDAFGAQAGVQAAQRLAQLLGVSLQPPKARRGPYQAARNHPLGLTRKELQVLKLLADGASNAEIATAQSRSVRTVEHHVSSILGKLNAAHRLEAILRVMAEPWILGNDE